MPVAAAVLAHAAARPERLALCGPHGDLTYAGLAARVVGGARHLAGAGTGAGAGTVAGTVAIGLADPVEVLVAALAADLAGATPLLCDPGWDPLRRQRVLDAMPVGAWLEEPLPAPDGPPPAARPAPDDLAWACFSSGSTGRPRAVVRTRASWTGSFPHVDALTGIGAGDVVLVPGPLVSSLYGFAAVHALAAGATALVPGRWAPDLLRHASVVHLVPHRLADLLDTGSAPRTAVVGGAALNLALRARAAAEGIRVVSYYGATELSFVAADADGTGLRAFPGVEIQIRDGEIWARSPWLARGYLGGADGPLRADAGGFASVGDLAEPYEPGGVLRVRGRGDEAIQTGGATVVPEDVEEVLKTVPGVGDVVVVGTPHPFLGSVVTAVVEGEVTRAELEAVARGGLDLAQRPRRWYAVASLPRTPSGKPARAAVAADVPGLRRLA
jgi:long-chain acyl-CoA synthetase